MCSECPPTPPNRTSASLPRKSAFKDNSHACKAGLLIIIYFWQAWGWKKKQREKQETKTCSSNLSAGTGRLVETFRWSVIRQPATPTVSAKVTAAAWFHHLASACCVFPSLDLSLFFWPPPPPPPSFLKEGRGGKEKDTTQYNYKWTWQP